MALKFIDMAKVSNSISPEIDESVLVKDFNDQFHAVITRKSVRTGSICSLAIPDKSEPSEILENLKTIDFRNNLRDYSADVFQATRLPVFSVALANNVNLNDSYVQVSYIPSFVESGDTVFFVRPPNASSTPGQASAEGPFYIDEVKENSFKIFPRSPQIFDSSYVVLFLSKTVAAVDFLQSGILQNHEMVTIHQSNTIEVGDTLLVETEARPYKVMNKGIRNSNQTDLRLFPLPKVTHPEGMVVYTRTPINDAPNYTLPSGSSRFNFNFVYDTKPEDDFAYVLKNTLRVGDVFYIENNTLIPYTVLSIDDKFPSFDKVILNKQIGKHYRGIKQGPLNASLVRLFGPNNKLLEIKDISKNTSIVSVSFDESSQIPYFLVSALDAEHNYVYYFVSGDFPSFQPEYLTRSLDLKYLNSVEAPIDFAVYQNVAYVLTDAKRVIAYTLKGVAMEVFNFEYVDDEITSIDYFSDFVSVKTTFINPIKFHKDNLATSTTLKAYNLVDTYAYNGSIVTTSEDNVFDVKTLDGDRIMQEGSFSNSIIEEGPLSGCNLSRLTLRHLLAFDGYLKYWIIEEDAQNPGFTHNPPRLKWVGPPDRTIVFEDELALNSENSFDPYFKYLKRSNLYNNIFFKVKKDWDDYYKDYVADTIPAIVKDGANRSVQLDNVSKKFLRYLILTGASGHIYFYDLIINRTVMSTKLAVNKPSLTCSSSVRKIKNQLRSLDLEDELRVFMSYDDAVRTVSTCMNAGISSYDYVYNEKLFFKKYEDYISSVYDSILKLDGFSAPGRPFTASLDVYPANSLSYQKDLIVNSATTEGIDLNKSILYGLAVYREQTNACKVVKFSESGTHSMASSVTINIEYNGVTDSYAQNFSSDGALLSLQQVLQRLSKKLNSSNGSKVNAVFEANENQFKIFSKNAGTQGNLISFDFAIVAPDSIIEADALSGSLEGGFDITKDEFSIDGEFPDSLDVYIERNNLFPVISGAADSKAGITLIGNNINIRAKVFEFTVKAWGDHGEVMVLTEITPTLIVYKDKDYNTPVVKLSGARVTTDERGIASGVINLSDQLLNLDSDSVDYLLQFQTKVVYQPDFNSLYIYDMSQTNVKGDERISFRLFGMQHPSNIRFRLVQDLHGLPEDTNSPEIFTYVEPIYVGDHIFELDFKSPGVSQLLESVESGSVLILDASEEVNLLGKRYNYSNSVAIIYTGLDD